MVTIQPPMCGRCDPSGRPAFQPSNLPTLRRDQGRLCGPAGGAPARANLLLSRLKSLTFTPSSLLKGVGLRWLDLPPYVAHQERVGRRRARGCRRVLYDDYGINVASPLIHDVIVVVHYLRIARDWVGWRELPVDSSLPCAYRAEG